MSSRAFQLEGALDYFSREIIQSRVQLRESRAHEGTEKEEGTQKRKRERETGRKGVGTACHDMWVLKIEHPKQP